MFTSKNDCFGWINIDLPWYDVSELTLAGIRDAWEIGDHHSRDKDSINREGGSSEYSALADAWVIQIPALKYIFSSSISNLEVVDKGGFVTTNHPEGNPSLSHASLAAKGNENLLGIHIPVMMPTKSSIVSGSSNVNVQLKVLKLYFVQTKIQKMLEWDGMENMEVVLQTGYQKILNILMIGFLIRINSICYQIILDGWIEAMVKPYTIVQKQ